MFLFSKKNKTPISTYTDSYRPPCTVKKTINDRLYYKLWEENKFVTKGLTLRQEENMMTQGEPQKYYKHANDSASYWPEKYCLTSSEVTYNPVSVKEDKQITWKTGPCNSTTWNKHSSYVTLQPKETKTETSLQCAPVLFPPKHICLDRFEREVVTETTPIYTTTRKGPFQGYYSLCSGHHYCPQGMDCLVDGVPAVRAHFYVPAVRSIQCCTYSPRAILCTSTHRAQPSSTCRSPRWDTCHFNVVGGVQRRSYTIHPEFASEARSAPWH
ncbi:SMRP1 protein, partial [Crotophaga sulcirostris]|nr:SMRP1 protein [Crotophaga sulcirostris]